jgi:5-(carboxyamino)imidazole ribonucleotide synthase
VGVVGAGQLARMLAEAASPLGIDVAVLAATADDGATGVASEVVIGRPDERAALRKLAGSCDVLTLDHELVDVDALDDLVREGVTLRPSTSALAFAQRKDFQRAELHRRGVPVPRFALADSDAENLVRRQTDQWGAVPVVKAAAGGYDGRGVVVTQDLAEALEAARRFAHSGPVVLEEPLTLRGELAIQVVTGPDGDARWWPLVRTSPDDGMCAEVRYPAAVDEQIRVEALDVAQRTASVVQAVGVLAIELFWTDDGILVNEVATRPHNSAHWTIEGCVTSQFQNHLRAVLGLPLGSTEPVAPAAVMVNVVGSEAPVDLAAALAVDHAHVHLYGKAPRPGRKLGHVTALGSTVEEAAVRAWRAAEALGTALRRPQS